MRASNLFTAFSWPRLAVIRDLLVIGIPIGLALLVEVGFFSVAGLLIGRLGVEAVASHQIAFNVAGIAFMVPLALGMAATIRVGFNVGAGDRDAARLSAWVAVTTTLVWGICVATVMLTARFPIVSLYTNNADVINVAAALLAIGALFQVFDSAQATTMGALRGYKATVAPMWIAVVAYWLVGLPVGAALCFGVGSFPPPTRVAVQCLRRADRRLRPMVGPGGRTRRGRRRPARLAGQDLPCARGTPVGDGLVPSRCPRCRHAPPRALAGVLGSPPRFDQELNRLIPPRRHPAA